MHYDYSVYAKPQALRTSVGAVLGQFQTYSINFFEYQRKILAEGGRDVISGDLTGDSAMRAYRLGMLYTLVQGLITPLTNTDLGSLIQNDTLDKIEGMYWYFMADPKEIDLDKLKYGGLYGEKWIKKIDAINELKQSGELKLKPQHLTQDQWNKYSLTQIEKKIKKYEQEEQRDLDKIRNRIGNAFWGLGPWSMIAGPTGTGLIQFGQWVSNLMMDDDELEELKTLYQEYGETAAPYQGDDQDNPYYELARMISPQFARTGFSTIPKIFAGSTGLPTALGQELSLYKPRYMPFSTRQYEERKSKILAGLRWMVPDAIEPQFLTPYSEREKVDKRQKPKYQVGTRKYTKDQFLELQRTLDTIQGNPSLKEREKDIEWAKKAGYQDLILRGDVK